MFNNMMIKSVVIAAIWGVALSVHAVAESPQAVDVPAGELVTALQQLAKQADVELMFKATELEGIQTLGVSGTLLPSEAIARLLEGTDLKVHVDTGGALLIGKEPLTSGRKTSFFDAGNKPVRVAQADGTEGVPVEGADGVKLEEVVVTAQKRVERLQDVPVPVSVLSADSLMQNGTVGLQEIYRKVPGLSLTGFFGGSSSIVIRGLSTGAFINPTTSTLIDEVPISYSTALNGGSTTRDLDPNDLLRIEVLKGPQGTLYGANSLGGLLKYVTIDPSVERFSGRIQGSVEDVKNGTGQGYTVRGSVNVPLSDVFAVRASAFSRNDAGFIDDPALNLKGINDSDSHGARVAMKWLMRENANLKAAALYQAWDTDAANSAFDGPGVPDLQNPAFVPNSAGEAGELTQLTANFDMLLGPAKLDVVTGYNQVEQFSRGNFNGPVDLTAPFDSAVPYFNDRDSHKFSQEVRVTLPIGESIDWLIGGFYTNERTKNKEAVYTGNAITGMLGTKLILIDSQTDYREYAPFTNLTWRIGDHFDIQGGMRLLQYKFKYDDITTADGSPPTVSNPPETSQSAQTFLITPRYRFSDDLMLYVRIATAFRPGASNGLASSIAGVPDEYESDDTTNYEFGLKGQALDDMLTYELSAYHIDWSNIQLPSSGLVGTTPVSYTDNGGKAKSDGLEVSLDVRPITGLTLSAWVSYNVAELTEDLPASSSLPGSKGDWLPYSSRYSGSFSAEQRLPLGDTKTVLLGASIDYTGKRKGDILAPRDEFPSYTVVDLRAGLESGDWVFNVYANNVADKRGILSRGFAEGIAPTGVFNNLIIKPRTIGMTATYRF